MRSNKDEERRGEERKREDPRMPRTRPTSCSQLLLLVAFLCFRLFLLVSVSCVSCVESGDNPSALTARFIDDVRFQNDSVRAQIFATKLLHDQLQLRMELWDEVLTTQAQAGNDSAKQLLLDAPTTGKQQVKT